MNAGGPAFPHVQVGPRGELAVDSLGMSLRDYFAGQCAHAALEIAATKSDSLNLNTAATIAYQMADAMLAQRDEALGYRLPDKVPEIHPGDCTCPACEPAGQEETK